MTGPRLDIRQVTMRFGDFAALEDINVSFEPGLVHAVVGQNGAGKTTFARVVCGLYEPTDGTVYLNEKPLTGGDVVTARKQGVDMVHQHFTSPPSMTIAECLALFSTESRPLHSRRALETQWQQTADSLGLGLDVGRKVRNLSVPQRQSLEITRALSGKARVLIFDEPTASIPAADVPALFDRIKSLAAEGLTVVVVLHKLSEVFAVADTVTVLEKGRITMTQTPIADLTPDVVAGHIIGESVSAGQATETVDSGGVTFDGSASPAAGSVLLKAEGLISKAPPNDAALQDVSFEIRQGEIIGIAGVEGNGQRSLVEAIVGLLPVQGQLNLSGQDITQMSVIARRRNGIRAIPFERNVEGVSSTSALWPNVAISEVMMQRSSIISRRKLRSHVTELLTKWNVSYRSLDQPAGQLSGGNVQRAILSRELDDKATLVLAAQPTRGLDIGAINFVQRSLTEIANRGGAVILVSSDLDELRALSTRILVVRGGKLVAELPPTSSLIEIGTQMVGGVHA
ncbi:ATP-binding cassette domain-containing protein [Paenarthrobacter sp. GOM3]|uniref:ABC transporter ATP-binding protein n=1 Tax=Paenarthrobacter sp. GOM3 TaxID=2782567 RepID=UPI001BAD7EA8|nr:ATP-binding cassette domain-containing protein [Paenarthrobacter sp. GOM3]WOH20566.1 ATP-binding cassette domain-containing protein [Paenarthrobacter sp. GOM3]